MESVKDGVLPGEESEAQREPGATSPELHVTRDRTGESGGPDPSTALDIEFLAIHLGHTRGEMSYHLFHIS